MSGAGGFVLLPVESFFLGSTAFFLAPKTKPRVAKFAKSSVPGNNQMLSSRD